MWILTYNGVTLQCHHADPIRREAVFAGPTYIHTKFRLAVQAIYNPALNAYAQTQPGVVVPAPAGAVIQAALTDVNLRHRLLQPRKQLVFTVAGIRQIVSPLPGYSVDANNGPVVMECSDTELHGTKNLLRVVGHRHLAQRSRDTAQQLQRFQSGGTEPAALPPLER